MAKKKKKNKISIKNRSLREDTNAEYPAFSFEKLRKKYSLETFEKNQKLSVLKVITQLSQITWADIRRQSACYYETIKKRGLKVEIPSFMTDDQGLISFRTSGSDRIIGYREGKIFYIVWIAGKNNPIYDH